MTHISCNISIGENKINKSFLISLIEEKRKGEKGERERKEEEKRKERSFLDVNSFPKQKSD